jgi:hypothetical protein
MSIFSVIILIGSAAQTVEIDALCFMPTDDINEPQDGDQIRLKNNHWSGPYWLQWTMVSYLPIVSLRNTEPEDRDYHARFYYKKFQDQTKGVYTISSFDGFSYYLCAPNGNSIFFDRLISNGENVAKWDLQMYGYDDARFVYANPDYFYPSPKYMFADLTNPRPRLEPYLIDGAKWSVELAHNCTIIYNVTADWGTGYNATITIENNTGHVITDWEVNFYFSYDVSSVSNAVLVSNDYKGTKIRNAGWNGTIQPASSVTFYMSGNDGNLVNDPWNFTVSTN